VSEKTHAPQTAPFRWEGVPVLAYKEEGGTHFKGITRQVLFDDPAGSQLRYFEIVPGGHSTLERHDHIHSVMILRGRGQALVGSEIHALETNDLVRVPPRTWHQFRATGGEPLGFLCVVRAERDKPQRPTAAELAALGADPRVGAFVRV
jgi:mannose-6-phosphate isomerase-like protein (cupin superfamily)